MQQQMQMMGIAPPPPGASAPAFGATSLPFAATPKAKSLSTEPSVVIALVVSAAYALAWIVGGNEFKYAFGETKVLSLLVFAAGIGLAVVALTKRAPLHAGLASGVALGLSGVGIVAVARLLSDYGMDGKAPLVFIPMDVAAFVGSALIVSRSASLSPPAAAAAWWKQASLGLAGAGVLLTFVASNADLSYLFVANVSVWGGFVVAGLCLLKGGRVPLALAAGWAATQVVYLLGTDFKGIGSSSAIAVLVMLTAAGMVGMSVWAMRQRDVALHDAVVMADAAPVATYARTENKFAPPPAPAPIASAPIQPKVLAVLPLISPASAAPEATVPRTRNLRQVRFATGELVPVGSTLVLGRAPVAPERHPASATFVVADASFTISSTHCLLIADEGGVWVEDLGSTNGTDVVSPSGTAELGIGQSVLLTAADRVQLGDNSCWVEP